MSRLGSTQHPDRDVGPTSVDPAFLHAGMAAIPLVTDPKRWINRRVETIEVLSHEQTRRQVSVDFTLSSDQRDALTTGEGVLVPISALAKRRRRNFDLRDEAGHADGVVESLAAELRLRLCLRSELTAGFSNTAMVSRCRARSSVWVCRPGSSSPRRDSGIRIVDS